MLQHDLKIAVRNLVKHKTQSAISIVGLAVGFMACILGGYWWWWETHFDNFHPEGDRLYALTTTGLVKKATGTDVDLDQLHIDDWAGLQALLPEIEAECSFQTSRVRLKSRQEPLFGIESDSSFCSLFRMDFLAGTYKGVAPDGQSVILTERVARQLYGTADCVGEELVTESDKRLLVAGVVKDYPDNSDLTFQYLLLHKPEPHPYIKRLTTYIRLRPGVDVQQVKGKLAAFTSHVGEGKINLRTLAEVHLYAHPELTDRFRNIRILALAGLMAFVSAWMNLLVLFIARQQEKRRKNKTCIYLGASFSRILFGGWTEFLLPLGVAFFLAFCLIECLYPYYAGYTSWDLYGIYEGVSRRIGRELLYQNALPVIGVSILLSLIVSYFPVRQILRRKEMYALRYKWGLITAQISIGSFFFITSLALFLQLHYIRTADRGLRYDHVIQVNLGYEHAYNNDIRVLKPELLHHPYVESVSCTAANTAVFTEQGDWYGSYISSFAVGRDTLRDANVLLVDKDFFSVFGLSLLRGDWIGEANPDDLLINETGYRTLGYPDLLERPVSAPYAQAKERNVSGIVKDYLYAPMQYPVQPLFFRLLTDHTRQFLPAQYIYVRYTPGHKEEVLAHIRETTDRRDSHEVSDDKKFVELNDVIERFNRPETVLFTLFSVLSLLCILISSFGIYALVSLSAEQRKKEMAIRKINGAGLRHILRIFVQEYILMTVTGNVFALSCGYIVMKRWLETYGNHIELRLWPFILVCCITASIVIFAVFLQVRKTASANPAETIKTE
ncbi:MAG: ABC transporter permease [Tannerellaceae bacterium]|jgi:hypothetical protein|nr:ABC transporter permease [Tannerellaceae bacterium]